MTKNRKLEESRASTAAAYELYINTPEYKVAEDARKSYEKACVARCETPEWKAYEAEAIAQHLLGTAIQLGLEE